MTQTILQHAKTLNYYLKKQLPQLILAFLIFVTFVQLTTAQELYWTEYTNVMKSNADGSNRVSLIYDVDNFQGLAIDTDAQKMYFLNIGEGSVQRADLDGSNLETVYTFATVPHGFRHLALDPPNEKIYVCSTTRDEVVRLNYDGTGFETIIEDCNIAHGVILDLDEQRMYYSCINSPYFVASADLDGTNRDTIVTNVKATGLALDAGNDHLYYFNQMNSNVTYDIMRVDTDGANDQLIYDAPTFAMTIRLDFVDEKIWLMLSGDYKIQKLNFDGTGLETVVFLWNTPYDLSLEYLHDGPLAVDWSYFKVNIQNFKEVLLEWNTASEKDNQGFEVEHSTDGINWRTLGFVEGHGTTSEAQRYSFEDKSPFLGDNYYRLKQLDHDGKFDYSEVRQVFFENGESHILYVFPNPVEDHFTIGINNPNGESAYVKLLSSSGQMVWEQTFERGEMNVKWEKEFNLPPHELYFVITQVGNTIETKKVVPIRK